jgi:hypothetical protein
MIDRTTFHEVQRPTSSSFKDVVARSQTTKQSWSRLRHNVIPTEESDDERRNHFGRPLIEGIPRLADSLGMTTLRP